MVTIRNVMVLLLGATLWMSSAHAVDQEWLEGVHNGTRKALAEKCLHEFRKASHFKEPETKKLWQERHNYLRQENENEPLSDADRARLENLVDGSQAQALPQTRLILASL